MYMAALSAIEPGGETKCEIKFAKSFSPHLPDDPPSASAEKRSREC